MSSNVAATVAATATTAPLEQEFERALFQMKVTKAFIERFYYMYSLDANVQKTRYVVFPYLQVVKKFDLSRRVAVLIDKLEKYFSVGDNSHFREDLFCYLRETPFEHEDYVAIDNLYSQKYGSSSRNIK